MRSSFETTASGNNRAEVEAVINVRSKSFFGHDRFEISRIEFKERSLAGAFGALFADEGKYSGTAKISEYDEDTWQHVLKRREAEAARAKRNAVRRRRVEEDFDDEDDDLD